MNQGQLDSVFSLFAYVDKFRKLLSVGSKRVKLRKTNWGGGGRGKAGRQIASWMTQLTGKSDFLVWVPSFTCTHVPKSPPNPTGLLQEPWKTACWGRGNVSCPRSACLYSSRGFILALCSVSLYKPGRSVIILETSIPLFHLVETGHGV